MIRSCDGDSSIVGDSKTNEVANVVEQEPCDHR